MNGDAKAPSNGSSKLYDLGEALATILAYLPMAGHNEMCSRLFMTGHKAIRRLIATFVHSTVLLDNVKPGPYAWYNLKSLSVVQSSFYVVDFSVIPTKLERLSLETRANTPNNLSFIDACWRYLRKNRRAKFFSFSCGCLNMHAGEGMHDFSSFTTLTSLRLDFGRQHGLVSGLRGPPLIWPPNLTTLSVPTYALDTVTSATLPSSLVELEAVLRLSQEECDKLLPNLVVFFGSNAEALPKTVTQLSLPIDVLNKIAVLPPNLTWLKTSGGQTISSLPPLPSSIMEIHSSLMLTTTALSDYISAPFFANLVHASVSITGNTTLIAFSSAIQVLKHLSHLEVVTVSMDDQAYFIPCGPTVKKLEMTVTMAPKFFLETLPTAKFHSLERLDLTVLTFGTGIDWTFHIGNCTTSADVPLPPLLVLHTDVNVVDTKIEVKGVTHTLTHPNQKSLSIDVSKDPNGSFVFTPLENDPWVLDCAERYDTLPSFYPVTRL
jgi:hypothetical protein